jgi:hypothetical protein
MPEQDVEAYCHDHQDHATHQEPDLVVRRLHLPKRDQEGQTQGDRDDELTARRHTFTSSRRPKIP